MPDEKVDQEALRATQDRANDASNASEEASDPRIELVSDRDGVSTTERSGTTDSNKE